MRYATGHAINVPELFCSFKKERLEMTSKECEELMGDRHKEDAVNRIFSTCAALIVEDVIKGDTFKLPLLKGKQAEIAMHEFNGDKFTKCRQNGKFEDVDFLASNFRGYQMIFNFQWGDTIRKKLIYLDPAHKDEITKQTNLGKIYYGQMC